MISTIIMTVGLVPLVIISLKKPVLAKAFLPYNIVLLVLLNECLVSDV